MSRRLQLFLLCLVIGWVIPTAVRAEDKDVKVIATAKDMGRSGSIGPFDISRNGVAIRSAEELVMVTRKAKSATEATVQKEMEAELAKLLKVESIDWKKQMVLATIAEDFESLKLGDKALTATYVPFKEPLMLGIPPTPKILVLVLRFEGEVKFVQKK